MHKRKHVRMLFVALSIAAWVPSMAADDPAQLKDLTSVLALLGMPCGQVVSAIRVKDDDHIVTCQDGNRYRVYLNAEGRVVAQKQ